MQRASRPDLNLPTPRRVKAVNFAILALSGLLVAGAGAAAVQGNRAEARAAEAAANYMLPVTYTPPPAPTEAAFLGDSFTHGTGASDRSDRWTSVLSREMGWVELNYGYGGTNYSTAGTLKGGRAYADRLTDLTVSQPDIVIVSSAGNNIGDDQEEGITRTFQQLREGLPDARIIATSPYYRAEDFPNSFAEFGEEIETAVEAVGGEYLEIGHPLGGHPEGMDDDLIHPNDTGHALIAEAVQQALEEA